MASTLYHDRPATLTPRRATLALELRQEPRVVVEEEPQIGQIVADHRHPLDAHPEREPGPLFRVDVAGLEDDGVNHPAAEDLDPPGVLADVAPFACPVRLAAVRARDVDLGPRLDERKVARAPADG